MKYCLLILSSLFFIASCSKVEVPLSKQEKLRESEWRVDTATITYLTTAGADSLMFGAWGSDPEYKKPDCVKDDYLKFRANFDGSHITGPDKCNVSESNDIEFTWGITENDTRMYMYGLYALLGQDATGDLVDFRDDQFVFAFPKKIKSGTGDTITVKYSVKFKKK
ncbi:MAG: hypothetical protein JNK00_02480 [Flavipsychrobacter sp.]|nr:hypothetical protein [Flavipsychrobacter sp.]